MQAQFWQGRGKQPGRRVVQILIHTLASVVLRWGSHGPSEPRGLQGAWGPTPLSHRNLHFSNTKHDAFEEIKQSKGHRTY